MSDEAIPVFPGPTPVVRVVPLDRPWVWLARGWHDFTRSVRVGFAYGALFVAVSFLVTLGLYLSDLLYLLLPLTAGFMFVAPLLAVGLYETSRRLAADEPVSLRAALRAWRRNRVQIVAFGVILMFFHLFWVRVAMLLYPLFFAGPNPSLADMPQILFFSPASLPFLVTGTVIGAVLAAIVFAISAVSIPMLVERDTDVITAIATSWTAVRHNAKPMALWAALIVVFTAAGLVLCYIGLAVVLPLVGYATWHCYKDLVA